MPLINRDDYEEFLAHSYSVPRDKMSKCRICGERFLHIDVAVAHEQFCHKEEISEYERRLKMAKKPCEHLNVENQSFSGVPMCVCKDCGKQVDPAQFEKVEIKNAALPIQVPVEGEKSVDAMKRILETLVGDMVQLPGLEKPFFPLFGVKKGDLVIVLREK